MRDWFISDTHFGHANIINHCDRPFASAEEMDQFMIDTWNATVAQTDRVWHIGDFGGVEANEEARKRLQKVLSKLKGQKFLVRGNHDERTGERLDGWTGVFDLKPIKSAGHRLFLCHYPMLAWPKGRSGSIMVHGHTHGRIPPSHNRIDAGVDVWGFRPVSTEELLGGLAERDETTLEYEDF